MRSLLISLAVLAWSATFPALADPIPWSGTEVDLVARDRPVTDFLRDIFAAEGLVVDVSRQVSGRMNGQFSGTAQDVFEQVAAAYGLVGYYDGSSVVVYDGSEVSSRMYSLTPELSRDVRQTLRELRIGDDRNTVRVTSDGVLVASGVPMYLDAISEVVSARSLAQTTDPGPMSFEVFPLRYAWAQDTTQRFGSTEITVPGVASVVRSLIGSGPAAPIQIERVDARMRSRPGMGNRDRSADEAFAATLVAQPLGTWPARPQIGERMPMTSVLPSLPPGVRVEADPRLNAVVVRDRPERMPIYRSLIEKLDKEPDVVAIEATIIDVDMDRLREIGVQWRYTGDDFDFTQGGRTTEGIPLSPEEFLNPFRNGLLASGVIGNENVLSARLAALETEGVARVVSSPQVLTLANVEAVFNNTRTFFVRVESRFDAQLFDITVGTTLSVTPHVLEGPDGELVKLLVNIEDGQLTNGEVDDIPIVETSGLTTQALMQMGESLLLGGLTVDESSSFEDGVPVLRSIPLLGRAFKSSRNREARIERMFLLTPRLGGTSANDVLRDGTRRGPALQRDPAVVREPEREVQASFVSVPRVKPARRPEANPLRRLAAEALRATETAMICEDWYSEEWCEGDV